MFTPARLAIHPKPAVGKFLVDMRLAADRGFRRWNWVLRGLLDECRLGPAEKRAIIQRERLDDYFFAALVAIHARTIREIYPPDVAEALMHELAVQLDGAVGASDSTVSHLVFVGLTRIRKAREEHNDIAHDQVIALLLERLGIDKHPATCHLMTKLLPRQTLAEPLAMARPSWWRAFAEIYLVVKPTPVAAPEWKVTIIDPLAAPLPRRTAAAQPPVRPAGPAVAPPISVWARPNLGTSRFGQ